MPRDKSKRKKDKEQRKNKEEEEGEGIPLKMANEYRRSNRMEPLTKEQHEARKAVIRANNQKAEEAIKRMHDQTDSDKAASSNTQSPSDAQRQPEANSVAVEESEKIEAERKNLESARGFQLIANLEHYKEKAKIESLRAENENQTGLQHNLSIDSLPPAGIDESLNLNQTLSNLMESKQSVEDPIQTLALPMALEIQAQDEEISGTSKERSNAPLLLLPGCNTKSPVG